MPRNRRVFAVIAGTGVIDHFDLGKRINVRTSFGRATAFLAREGGFLVLPRHGPEHGVPPHMINYRANIAALSKLGVTDIVATSAVGSMNREFAVGELGLVSQFLDFTKKRKDTFFDHTVVHTDVTNPYSDRLNEELKKTAKKLGIGLHPDLVYVCAEGPRFESAAEVRMFRSLGGDVVGMTGVPEVVLANEKGIRYASVVVSTNLAPGLQKKVSHEEVVRAMGRSGRKARDLTQAMIKGETKGGNP
jgi:5'-methylthioadenosine phosphorylase